MMPSQDESRHLKSGARGLRLEARLSHISPWHFGHLGAGVSAGVGSASAVMSELAGREGEHEYNAGRARSQWIAVLA